MLLLTLHPFSFCLLVFVYDGKKWQDIHIGHKVKKFKCTDVVSRTTTITIKSGDWTPNLFS